MLSGTATHTATRLAGRVQKVGGGLSVGVDADRLMLSGATPGHRPGPDAGAARRRADRGRLPRRLGGDRAGPTGRPDPGRPEPAGATWPGPRCSSGSTASTRTPCRPPSRTRYAAVTAGRPAPAARRAGAPGRRGAGAGRRRAPERALDAAEQALSGWDGAGNVAELPPAPPLEPGPLLLVDRPGSVQSSLRIAAAGGAPHPSRPRRAATGQPGLRWLLLLPLGGEHPRGQGLHVRAALGGRAFGGRVGADRSMPRWPPR